MERGMVVEGETHVLNIFNETSKARYYLFSLSRGYNEQPFNFVSFVFLTTLLLQGVVYILQVGRVRFVKKKKRKEIVKKANSYNELTQNLCLRMYLYCDVFIYTRKEKKKKPLW